MVLLFFDISSRKFYFPEKKLGKTTRIVDRCIQEFFDNKITFVYDGRGEINNKEQTENTFSIFIKRLELEHPKVKYFYRFGNYDGIDCYKVESHNL